MAIVVTENDRFETVATRLGQVNNRISITRNTGSLVLELEVIGTHFPARALANPGYSPFVILENLNGLDGVVSIDYNDGTGWHDYPFISSGNTRRMTIERKSDNEIGTTPSPSNISETGTFNYPVYFYQDLGLPTGTVDDEYNHHRKINIKFEKFFDLKTFNISNVGLYGILPESIGRLRNLGELTIRYPYHLTGVDVDFTKVFCRTLEFSILGFSLGTTIPQFILNSFSLVNVSLYAMLNLSGTAASTRLDEFFSNTLPDINSFDFGDCGIDFQIPNLQRIMTGSCVLQNNRSTNFRLSPDLTTWHFGAVYLSGTKMPYTEYQRLLNDSQVIFISMVNMDLNVDFDITQNNYLTRLNIDGVYGGFFPTFLSKLNALTNLTYRHSGEVGINSWGNSGFPSSLENLSLFYLENLPTLMPNWFVNLVSLTSFSSYCWQTQTRIDDHISSFYGIVDANSPKTGTGLFRGLNYRIVTQNLATNTNLRPTGTYQQPTGYVQGTNNGTPASQMEMIWVFVHQYAMIVSVLNAAGNGIDIYTP